MKMQIQRYKVKMTFTEPVLGSAPLNQQIYNDYIRSKEPTMEPAETADEMETIIPADDKGKTGFHRLEDGTPIIYDYVIRGFFKDACGMMGRVENSQSKKLRAYKKVIDGLVFIEPRRIPITVNGEESELQRPLRAQTMQGERVALACSEMLPAGSSAEFEVLVLDDKTVSQELIEEWLQYARFRGFGSWRNASYGRVETQIERIEATV